MCRKKREKKTVIGEESIFTWVPHVVFNPLAAPMKEWTPPQFHRFCRFLFVMVLSKCYPHHHTVFTKSHALLAESASSESVSKISSCTICILFLKIHTIMVKGKLYFTEKNAVFYYFPLVYLKTRCQILVLPLSEYIYCLIPSNYKY
jgi:hypothetical protein